MKNSPMAPAHVRAVRSVFTNAPENVRMPESPDAPLGALFAEAARRRLSLVIPLLGVALIILLHYWLSAVPNPEEVSLAILACIFAVG